MAAWTRRARWPMLSRTMLRYPFTRRWRTATRWSRRSSGSRPTWRSELLADGRGGVGYLLKDRVADPDEFVDAVRRVAGGGTALDPEAVAQLFARRRGHAPLDELTPREREVLAVLAYLRG